MPNLRPWIEAQLKRGYLKRDIKSYLSRKCYPQAAVAEVNKVNNSKKPSAYSIRLRVVGN